MAVWVEIVAPDKRRVEVAAGGQEQVALHASAGFRDLVGVVEANQDSEIEVQWGFPASGGPVQWRLKETISLSANIARNFVLDVVCPIVKVVLKAGAADTTFFVYAALRG